MSLDLTPLPEPALDELSPDLLAELPPHLVFAGTKPTHRHCLLESSYLKEYSPQPCVA